MCMMFYRRDTHVAEIQMGSPAMRLEDACAPDHFDINKLQFVTLLGECLRMSVLECELSSNAEFLPPTSLPLSLRSRESRVGSLSH